MIAKELKYPIGTVKHIAIDEDVDGVLSMVDLIIYGSFYEEQSFPEILKRAMCLEKPIIAPDHALIKKYVSLYAMFPSSCVYGYLSLKLYSTEKNDLKDLFPCVHFTNYRT